MSLRRRKLRVWTGPGKSPLELYLEQEQGALAEILRDLEDAADDADRRLFALARKRGVGAQVRRAQFSLIRRQLVLTQTVLWNSIGKRIRDYGKDVARAAARSEQQLQRMLFRSVGREVPEDLLAAQTAYAERVVQTYFARRQGKKFPLSTQVFHTRALTQGWVDRAVNRVILRGGSWQELAQDVRSLIIPTVPGGVSYAAKRLARTELNNAFHEVNRQNAVQNPYSTGMQWHLSGTHTRKDACDERARGHSPGRVSGVYALGDVPDKPHPQCLCFVTPVMMDEEQFLRELVRTTFPELIEDYRQAAAG